MYVRHESRTSITIDGTRIEKQVEVLGFILDNKLCFSPRNNSACAKSYRLLRKIASIKTFLSFNLKNFQLPLLQTITLDHCNTYLHVAPIKKLRRFKIRAARLLVALANSLVSLNNFQWLPIWKTVVYWISCFVYRLYHDLLCAY